MWYIVLSGAGSWLANTTVSGFEYQKHENKSYEIQLNLTNLPAFLKTFQ
jgi:hypothetical protein